MTEFEKAMLRKPDEFKDMSADELAKIGYDRLVIEIYKFRLYLGVDISDGFVTELANAVRDEILGKR